MSSRGVLIFVEGDTEVGFFKAVVKYLQQQNPTSYRQIKIIYRNAKGIDKFQSKVIRVFRSQILRDYPNVIFDVVLCYDIDVFEFAQKPQLNWELIENELKAAGAVNVYHVKAKQSIEDWFLADYPGILRFLNLPEDTKPPSGKGLDKLKCLFKKAHKFYVKGSKMDGFINQLDIEKIVTSKSKELKPLIRALKKTNPKPKRPKK